MTVKVVPWFNMAFDEMDNSMGEVCRNPQLCLQEVPPISCNSEMSQFTSGMYFNQRIFVGRLRFDPRGFPWLVIKEIPAIAVRPAPSNLPWPTPLVAGARHYPTFYLNPGSIECYISVSAPDLPLPLYNIRASCWKFYDVTSWMRYVCSKGNRHYLRRPSVTFNSYLLLSFPLVYSYMDEYQYIW